jgi:hypothetical protein
MKKFLLLASVVLLPSVANAAIYATTFSGTVASETGFDQNAVGSTVTGSFIYNADAGAYVSFIINGVNAPAGSASSALITLGQTDAIFQSQLSPVSAGGSTNTTLALDLSALTSFPTTDTALSLLVDATQIPGNLDIASGSTNGFPSTFSIYEANADGTNLQTLTADLTSVSTFIPEPAGIALLAMSMLGLGFVRRRG